MDIIRHPRKETDERLLEGVRRLIVDGHIKNERQFALELGLNPAIVYKVRQGIQSFPGEVAFEMAARWGISVDFIRYGKGGVYAGAPAPMPESEGRYSLIPLVDVPARASFVSGYSGGSPLKDLERVPVMLDPSLGRITDALLVEVEGDSMAPTLQPRDRLVVTQVDKADWAHQSGGIYVVVFRDQVAVKRIARNHLADKGLLFLVSDNPVGGEMAVNGQEVLGLYRIRQMLRVF